MGRLGKKFEEIMSAIAFAEEGEFEAARQMEKNGKVLCVLRGVEEDRKPFKYALNISKRIGAGLEVLYVSGRKGIEGLLEALQEEARKEGVPFKAETKNGCVKKEMLDYAGKRRDIQFVVVESSSALDMDCSGEKIPSKLEGLGCPLVVVSDAA